MPNDNEPKAYTPARFAEILGCSTETIRRRIRAGEIEVKNRGTEERPRYVIPGPELDPYIEDVQGDGGDDDGE
ncbi:MAG: helix-turn-helix domain-containing protein [Bradymonadaceae bacterium]